MNTATAPSSHRHGNLKQALLDYAVEAARSGTLDHLSLRKASRDLGVSPGAAYRHFVDRDDLMRAVAQRGFDALAARFDEVLPFESNAPSATAARGRFYALAKEYAKFAKENYGLWRLMFGPYGLISNNDRTRPSTYDWLGKALAELAEKDVIAPVKPAAQFFAWSAIHGLSDLQASPAAASSPDGEIVETQCAFILSALAS